MLTATMTSVTSKTNAELYDREVDRLVELAKRMGDPSPRFELVRSASSFRKLAQQFSLEALKSRS
jgi:hypothetical protein